MAESSVVTVDTGDEAVVERVARAIWEFGWKRSTEWMQNRGEPVTGDEWSWETVPPGTKNRKRECARAVLGALRGDT